jgi:hypothetical protein
MNGQLYINAFINSIKQRNADIESLLIKKLKFEKKELENMTSGFTNRKDILQIIGKDTFFRKAENNNDKTLRRLLFITIRSMERADKKLIYFEEEIKKMRLNHIDKDIHNAFLEVFKFNKEKIELLKKLENNFIQQAHVLESDDLDYRNKYIQLSKKEYEIMKEIYLFDNKNGLNIIRNIKQRNEYLKKYLEESKNINKELSILFKANLKFCLIAGLSFGAVSYKFTNNFSLLFAPILISIYYIIEKSIKHNPLHHDTSKYEKELKDICSID